MTEPTRRANAIAAAAERMEELMLEELRVECERLGIDPPSASALVRRLQVDTFTSWMQGSRNRDVLNRLIAECENPGSDPSALEDAKNLFPPEDIITVGAMP